ncbi:MAG: helix-turn-helix transcriptional regulator [Coriobacteriales bacterium]|jgi:DNA-binding CsgD family transcriptional regulator|nr:helix-turn-helix transcriptional regulator [Coriobacteriales bacterium]
MGDTVQMGEPIQLGDAAHPQNAKASAPTPAQKATSAEDTWRVNPYYLLGFLGTSLYAAWLFLQYINPLFAADPGLDASEGISYHFVFIAVTVLALVVTWLFSDAISTPRGLGTLCALAIVCGPASSLAPYLSALAWADELAWSLSAIGYAALMLLWSTLLVTLRGSQAPVYVAATLIAGAAIYVFVDSVIGPLTFPLTAALPVLSSLLFLLSFKSRSTVVPEQESTLRVTAADSDEKDPVTWKLIADTLTYTPCLGIGVYCALNFMPYPANIICVGVATMLSCAVIVVDFTRVRLLTSKMQLKLFLPLAALTVFPLSFVSGPLVGVFVFLIFLVFMLSLVTNYAAVSECSRIFELNPIRFFSYGRAYTIFGVLIGYLFASFAFGDFVVSHGGTILAFAGILFVFIIAATFILEDHYPTSTEVGDDLDTITKPPANTRDYWDERCAVISREYGLSARQSEVLKLLAKGRNTGYIQKHLVISPYTAKAHIYNIYQKIGIHSRQELLDRFEEVELD